MLELRDAAVLQMQMDAVLDGWNIKEEILPQVQYTNPDYFRKTLLKTDQLEVVLVCFEHLQSTRLHNHGGSHCMVKCLRGRLIEHVYYEKLLSHDLEYHSMRIIQEKSVIYVPPLAYHQNTNLSKMGSVLLNFYWPPLPVLEAEKPELPLNKV